MIKKTSLIFLLVMIISKGFAQDQDPQLPQLLPVTPTAAGLIKAGMGEVNKSTGAATAAISLYGIKAGNFTLPVSLNYCSQGNKAEELCSRVGYGWSLSAGGVITRRIMGMPDGSVARYPVPAGSLAVESQENLDFFDAAKTSGAMNDARDAQPDEYHFSFCGHSGKFVIDDNGNPVIISHENLKIAIAGSPEISIITITAPDGIQYLFGGNDGYEKTNHTGSGSGIFPKTSFYLTKVILPAGQQISLTYTRLQTTANTGFSETAKFPVQCPAGAPYPNGMTRSFSFQYIVNDACYLSSISTSEGVQASFGYISMADLSGDKKLQSFSVVNQNSKEVKRFEFEYGDEEGYINAYPNSLNTNIAGRNGRFYLKKLHEKYIVNVDRPESLDYSFDYYGNTAGITTNVYAQDHYGFKNGKGNQSIIPATSFLTQASPGTYWADRTSDWHASVQGMLHTITYPTKGKEDFFYEANTISVMKDAPDYKYITRSIYGTDQPATNYDYLTVLKDQKIYINLSSVMLSPSCTPVCSICKFIRFIVKDVTNNTPMRTYYLTGNNNSIYDSLNIIAGHQYSFESFLYPSVAQCNRADIQVKYDAAPPGLHPSEEEAGGVRVSRIAKTDAFGASLNKYFYYGAYNNPLVSTGQLLVNGSYAHNARTWGSYEGTPVECSYAYWSSDGIYNTCASDQSHIFYRNIVEADKPLDDASFANGATEYTFSIPAEDNINQIGVRGEVIPNPPGGLFPNAAGQIEKIRYFDNGSVLKATEENTYEKIYFGTPVRSIYIRKAFSIVSGGSVWVPLTVHNLTSQFDVRETQYNPGWIRLANTKKTQYDKQGNPFVTNTAYTYGTPANVQPAQISTTDSKGNTIVSVKKYPNDFPSDPVLTAMTAANIISPAIEESKKQNLTELAKTIVTYQNNGVAGGGFQPVKVQQKQAEAGTMEDRILFSGYDSKGNLTEVSKAMDSRSAYLWDYSQSLVIAEVKNSVKENIAYTSFEADSKGNFTYTGAATADVTAPTGRKAYNLSGGAITAPATAALSKPYIISYWSNSGAKSVSGSSLTTGRSVSGWTYYEHTVSSLAAGTTISGSGLIDELRMYPADALMTTYTYEPLVGVTSQCDVNNRISYYEYDGLNRLVFIRDQNKNIAKKICYNYAGLPENCSGVASYQNVAASRTYIRSNCGPGYTGTSYTYTVPAGTYHAASQPEADQMAEADLTANGQSQANMDGHGSCVASQVGNVQVSNSIAKNDCGAGYTGTVVTLTVYANTFFANTQAEADALANTYLANNLQSNANAGGSCIAASCSPSTCTGPANKCINNICQQGTRYNQSSLRMKINGVFKYRCTYIYCFSDNTYTGPFTEDNDAACSVAVGPCME